MNTKYLSIAGLLLIILFLGLFKLLGSKNPSTDLSPPLLTVSRTFGYGLGDLVEHQISVSAPVPYVLETNVLPKPGSLNTWLYLRQIKIKTEQDNNLNHYQIQITYQLFQGVKQATRIKIPSFPLHFTDAQRRLNTQTPPWVFEYTPLIPATTANERIQIRPTMALPPTALSQSIYTFTLLLIGCLMTTLYAAWRFDLLPFLRRSSRPFAQAYNQIRQLQDPETDPEVYLTALKIIHQAFNHSAGHTVFFERIDEFYQQKPGFNKFKTETQQFFNASQQAFFAPEQSSAQLSLEQLKQLCRQHRNIERLCH